MAAPPAAEPASAPSTTFPAYTMSSGRGPVHRNLAISGAVVGVIVIVVVAFILGRHHNSNHTPQAQSVATSGPISQPRTVDTSDVDSALRDLATAEESYLTDNNTYTSSGDGLADEGFDANDVPNITIAIGFDDEIGYCLLGSLSGTGAWRLYDSEAGGFSQSTYSDEADAGAACHDPAITRFHNTADYLSGPEGVQDDMRSAATAEERHLTDYDTYTNSLSDLVEEGFNYTADETISAGFDGSDGYCIVGSGNGYSWHLYDSRAGGMSPSTFNTEDEAEASCSQPISNFG